MNASSDSELPYKAMVLRSDGKMMCVGKVRAIGDARMLIKHWANAYVTFNGTLVHTQGKIN